MHPVSKYMTFNYARIVCFVVSAQLPEVLYNKENTTNQNKQNLINETSQRWFYQSASRSQPDLLPVLITAQTLQARL